MNTDSEKPKKPCVVWSPSPNFGRPIRYIIIHGTGMKSEVDVLQRLCDEKSEVSCHYFIGLDGVLHQLVEDKEVAWHAGISSWGNEKSLNFTSLGIELFNTSAGNSIPYSEKQYKALVSLLTYLVSKYHIKIDNILGHSDISPNRKTDPGNLFDWKRVKKELTSCYIY